MIRLSDKIGTRDNRFDQIRLALALAVVLGHGWFIVGGPEARVPLQDWTLIGFHQYAVILFFALSGFLVAESARRRQRDIPGFLLARAARIYPALVVCAVATPLALIASGAWTGATPGTALAYSLRLIGIVSIQFDVTGAFPGLPFEGAVNGSVWSLRHEIGAYLLLAAFAATGRFFRSNRFLVLYAGVIVLVSIAGHGLADQVTGGPLVLIVEARQVVVGFLLGVLAHRFAAKIVLGWRIGLVAIAGAILARLLAPEPVAILALAATTGYILLLAAYLGKAPRGLPDDVSYGVYIFGWPIQQIAAYWYLERVGTVPDPVLLFALVAPVLALLGLLSWRLVERPAMQGVAMFGRRVAAGRLRA